jgi:hypothetical protein
VAVRFELQARTTAECIASGNRAPMETFLNSSYSSLFRACFFPG